MNRPIERCAIAVFVFIGLSAAHVGAQPTPSGINLALNTSRSGYPSPLGSDHGWGGGTNQWEIVDGIEGYTDTWAHGLAFTGGHQSAAGGPPWIDLCGIRQATIDFGKLVTFNTVRIWHHGVEYTAQSPWLDYWDGTAWVRIAPTTHVYPAGHVDGAGYADAELFGFAAVTGSKVRYSMDNCGFNVLGTYNIHGWINEFEVYGCDRAAPTAEQFQVPTTGLSSDNPPASGWFFSTPPPGSPEPWHGYNFVQKLLGRNYSGTTLKEFDVPGGSSDCSTLSGTLPFAISGSTWTDIKSDNLFGDHIGYPDRIIRDVRGSLIAAGKPSCSVISFQQMKMFCPVLNDYIPYGSVNRIEVTIYADRVSFSRAGVGTSIRFR